VIVIFSNLTQLIVFLQVILIVIIIIYIAKTLKIALVRFPNITLNGATKRIKIEIIRNKCLNKIYILYWDML